MVESTTSPNLQPGVIPPPPKMQAVGASPTLNQPISGSQQGSFQQGMTQQGTSQPIYGQQEPIQPSMTQQGTGQGSFQQGITQQETSQPIYGQQPIQPPSPSMTQQGTSQQERVPLQPTTVFTPQLQTQEAYERHTTEQNLASQQQPIGSYSQQQQPQITEQIEQPEKKSIYSGTTHFPPVGAGAVSTVAKSTEEPVHERYEPPSMKAVITMDMDSESPERVLMYLDKYPQPSFRSLAPDEVIVKIKNASVNVIDYKINQGKVPSMFLYAHQYYFPFVGGRDGSGTVFKIADPQRMVYLREGDPVMGFTSNLRYGTFGQYAVFRESEFIMKPNSLTFEEASCIPFCAVTAMRCFQKADEKKKKRRGPSTSPTMPGTTAPPTSNINMDSVVALLFGDKFGSVLIHGGDTDVGSWCILLAKHYYKVQRIYTTVNCKEDPFAESYVKKLGADVVIDDSHPYYEELIQADLSRYWDEFCSELLKVFFVEELRQTPTENVPSGAAVSTSETIQQQQPLGVVSPRQEPQTTTTQATVPATTQTSPQYVPQWPHPAFKSRKEMEKCKNIVGGIHLAIDTHGGNDIANRCFSLLYGNTSSFVTLAPPPELEQKKLSGKDVWKLVSSSAANKFKSFFTNYPHFHSVLTLDADKELLKEVVMWYEQESSWLRPLLEFKRYELRNLPQALEDCRHRRFPGKIVIDMPESSSVVQ